MHYHTRLGRCFSNHETACNYLARSREGYRGGAGGGRGTGGVLGNLQRESLMEKEPRNGMCGRQNEVSSKSSEDNMIKRV